MKCEVAELRCSRCDELCGGSGKWKIRFGNLEGSPVVCERCIARMLGLNAEWKVRQ